MTLDTALKQIEELIKQNRKLSGQNKKLVEENRMLRERIKELEIQLKKILGSGKSWYSNRKKNKGGGLRNLNSEEREKRKKEAIRQANAKRGAKVGHEGHGRKRREADQHVHLKLEICPHCQHKIDGNQSEKYSRQILELINIPLLQILEYHFYQAHCPHCQRTVSTGMDNLPKVKRHQFVSNRVKAFISVLKSDNFTGDQIYKLLNFLAGFDFRKPLISKGEIMETYLKIKKFGKAKREEVLEKIKLSKSSHWDETGLSCAGQRGYVWLGRTDKEAYYRTEVTRGSRVVEGSLGTDYQGIIVADFYSGYRSALYLIQRCWIHLLRRLDKMYELRPHNKEIRHLREKLKYMYQSFTDEEFRRKLEQDKEFRDLAYKHFYSWLEGIVTQKKYKCRDVIQITGTLSKHLDEMFRFLKQPGVLWHNNPGERSMRKVARYRDNSNCVQSERGMIAFATAKTLLETCRLRGDNEFQFFLDLISTSH